MFTLLFNDHITLKQSSSEKKRISKRIFNFTRLYILYNHKTLIPNYHNKTASQLYIINPPNLIQSFF